MIGDIMGIWHDRDIGKIWFTKNNEKYDECEITDNNLKTSSLLVTMQFTKPHKVKQVDPVVFTPKKPELCGCKVLNQYFIQEISTKDKALEIAYQEIKELKQENSKLKSRIEEDLMPIREHKKKLDEAQEQAKKYKKTLDKMRYKMDHDVDKDLKHTPGRAISKLLGVHDESLT